MQIIKNKPIYNKMPTGKMWVFFAKPKIGKSTFGASWPNSVIFDFENGTSEIECNIIKPKNLIEFRKNLVDAQLKQFDTIVIDTFDVVYSMISDEVLERMNRQNKTNYQSIGEFGFGTGWSNSKIATQKLIVQYFYPLMNQGKNIVFLLHEKSEIISREGKPDRTIYNISLPGQTAGLVVGMVYTIGRIFIENNKHLISFSPAVDMTGSRCKALAGKTIPLSYKIMVETVEKYTGKI